MSQTDYQHVQNTALYRLSNRVYFIPDVLGTLFILFRMYRPLRRYIGDGIKKSLYESTTGKRPPSLTGGMRNGWFRNARMLHWNGHTLFAKMKRGLVITEVQERQQQRAYLTSRGLQNYCNEQVLVHQPRISVTIRCHEPQLVLSDQNTPRRKCFQ